MNAPAWKCQFAVYSGKIVVDPFLNDDVNVGGSTADEVVIVGGGGFVITRVKLATFGVICLLGARRGAKGSS